MKLVLLFLLTHGGFWNKLGWRRSVGSLMASYSFWSMHHCGMWKDLDALQEPTTVGRRLDVGGFILADSFEFFLTNISQAYLRDAWQRLSRILAQYDVRPNDLSWGMLHPGETYLPDHKAASPGDYVGWTSRELADFDDDIRYRQIDKELAKETPTIRCAVTWRSLKWAIDPDSYALALRLIEALDTDELTDWHPDFVLQDRPNPTEAWLKIAKAIQDQDQQQLDVAVNAAQASYSPLGYRMVIRAYTAHLAANYVPLQMPALQV
jgi:hypothetical protein